MMNLNLIPSEIPANSLNSETGQANSVTPIASVVNTISRNKSTG